MTDKGKTIKVLVGTVGGQGGGLLCDWFIRGLLHAGWRAQSIGLLGLSQRAGSVIYYVEACPPGAGPAIFSAYAVPGDVDLLLSQEFLELGRLLQGGFAGEHCTIVANTHRYLGTLEKMPAEGGIYPSGAIRKAAEALSDDAYLLHAQDLVVEAGLSHLSSNALLLGATVASRVFDLPREPFERAIREAETSVDDNLRAFALGYEKMRDGTLPRAMFREKPQLDWQQLAEQRAGQLPPRLAAAYRQLLDEARQQMPAALNRILAEALYRLIDFQDTAYAREYLQRVAALKELESCDDDQWPLTCAYARGLAEWLTYEDGPRVAQLKTRPARFAEIRASHGAKPGDRLLVDDYLAPDPPQIYGMLPVWLATPIRKLGLAWREDFDDISLPMTVRTSGLWGYSMLRLTALARRWRRASWRHRQELALVERWDNAVKGWLARDRRLGLLAAQAARVVKGYGHVRAKALDDLWTFLDQGLPLLEAAGKDGLDLATVGDEALKTLSSEAGKGNATLALIRKATTTDQAAA